VGDEEGQDVEHLGLHGDEAVATTQLAARRIELELGERNDHTPMVADARPPRAQPASRFNRPTRLDLRTYHVAGVGASLPASRGTHGAGVRQLRT
jgi:hypothetical protein